MRPSSILFLTLTLLALVGATANAAEPVGPKLPPQVRSLLVQEMNAILDASEAILGAIVRGQDDVVATKAQAIHDSFVLRQEMTAENRKAFMEAVPPSFVKRDRAFHRLTAELAAAAREENRVRQRRLYAEMIEACTACHSRYASDRFPRLQ
ncbi:hypothetical protein [Arhodomonas sp. AD133]|uniref:hypothetical protein n=1 Tax=Arhodomonas sp. AD133 TaxID=3415009 RepID=UPI003EC0A6D5